MKLKYFKILIALTGLIAVGSSCKRNLNINQDPDRLLYPNNTVYPQLLTNAEVTMGFEGGGDLFRYSTLIMQQMSGLASSPNQTYEYARYNITGTDQNNLWSSMNANTLSDLEQVIRQATEVGSPHYVGVAKILKAYEYSLMVDTWGDIPFTETQLYLANTQPHYDDDATIYPKLITLINEGIADMNAGTSLLSPGTNSVIYSSSAFTTGSRPFWIKLANTLKLRLYLHYSKLNPTFAIAQMNALIGSTGVTFFTSNADNFSVPFFNSANQRNSIETFERNRAGYLYADQQLVGMMNARFDPRRPFYFTSFPYAGVTAPFYFNTSAATATGNVLTMASVTGVAVGMRVTSVNIPANTTVTAVNTTANTVTLSSSVTGAGVGSGVSILFSPNAFVGVSAANPPANANSSYSRIHTFLRGKVLTGVAPPFTYEGSAPQRMITFAEYNFIRAEAALMGVSGPSAQSFFTAGITASMQEVGVDPLEISLYLAANGTLTGTTANMLQQIIEEKYIALFGVSMEPWTDWRRTGYPALTPPTNRLATVPNVPRSLLYPQSEIDLNGNHPPQKSGDLQTRVFWDNP